MIQYCVGVHEDNNSTFYL